MGGIGWDKDFLKSKLHVYGIDDIKIIIYNMKMWLKEGGSLEKHQREKPLGTIHWILVIVFINKIL